MMGAQLKPGVNAVSAWFARPKSSFAIAMLKVADYFYAPPLSPNQSDLLKSHQFPK